MQVCKHWVQTASGPMDIGYVGDVEHIDTAPLLDLIGKGMIRWSRRLAAARRARASTSMPIPRLGKSPPPCTPRSWVFLTDVQGIMRDLADDASLLSTVHVSEVGELFDQGVIGGGMIPKVEACIKSVKAGVRKTHVIDGRVPQAMLPRVLPPGRALAPKLSSRTTEKSMKTEDIIKGEAQYILQTYGRPSSY